jgi:hypothetical protein
MGVISVLDDAAFQAAFVAVGYLIRSDAERRIPFVNARPTTRELVRELESEERPVRARALGRELEVIARHLEERRLA